MKRINVLAASFFIAAFVIGAFAVGSFTQAQSSAVACSVSRSPVTAGSAVTFTASGGTGTYTWSSPNLVITNPTSSSTNFTATFNTPGNYVVNVVSGGSIAICNLAVTAVEAPDPGPITPGLPNTGELSA